MSEQLRHKMIDFEVEPLPTAWQAISARLEDDVQYAVLSAKMKNCEIIAPSSLWENVSTRLNDDKQYRVVSGKMSDFDITPPSTAWEAISERLYDDEQYTELSVKMNVFNTVPPAQIWNNVLSTLEQTNSNTAPARVTNINRLIYRIAAAAILVGLFVGGWMMIKSNNSNTEIVKNNKNIAPVKPEANKQEEKRTGDNAVVNKKDDNVAIQNNHKDQHLIKTNPSSLTTDKDNEADKYATINKSSSQHKIPASSVSAPPILDKDGNPIMDIDVLTTSNYIVVAGPNGQLTRISSKFANVIRFLNDNDGDNEEYINKVIKESSTWKKRFQEWRNKISQSSYIPSSANFLDIAEFKELIEEKK